MKKSLIRVCAALVFTLASCDSLLSNIEADSSLLSNANLSLLEVNVGPRSPTFDPSVAGYSITVGSDISTARITATKEKAGARLDTRINSAGWLELSSGIASPDLDLVIGGNTIYVRVTAENDSTTKLYTIQINRLNPDSALSALYLSGAILNPVFNANTLKYSASVANSIASITVGATTASPNATVQARSNNESTWHSFASGGTSPSLTLDIIGDNLVEVSVLAENGIDSTTYEISIHRKNIDSNLQVPVPNTGSLSPAFTPGTISYSLPVGSAVNAISFTPTASSQYASIEIRIGAGGWAACASAELSSSFTLPSDNSVVDIRVTAEDRSPQKTYSISVHRKSGNADLAALSITPPVFSPSFSSVITTYSAGVNTATTNTSVTPTKAHSLASISVRIDSSGWISVASGSAQDLSLVAGTNIIEVLVVAEDTAVNKYYAVKVVKPCAGAIDLAFMASGTYAGVGGLVVVRAIRVQADGKILIAGDFASYNGTGRGNIARLISDGGLDTTFLSTGVGANDDILDMALQPDGKILIAGLFTSYNGLARGRIARLNVDGSLDTSFPTSGSGADNLVAAMAIQVDGKILIGGLFTSYNGTSWSKLARLNADGTIDSTFLAAGTGVGEGSGGTGTVGCIAIQSDGKLVIGGYFATYKGITRGDIARVNSDGSLDTTFLTTGVGANESVSKVVFLPDGKLLISGWFSTFNGLTNRGRFTRLNSNGSADTTFISSTTSGMDISQVYSIVVQASGKILIGGPFTVYNGVSRICLARPNADGTIDSSLAVYGAKNGYDAVLSIAVQGDGKIIAGGFFMQFNKVETGNLMRILIE
ncbi:MAG TPA: cadherin-like beta sandwich domain-containing protein [bacterium]|nr:cadherin-like beta sandwich domain-containing protein [bacterium]